MAIHERYLHIYLRDHYAGSTGGLALAQRIARNHAGRWPDADVRALAADVAEDRSTLEQIMAALGCRPDPVKAAGALVAERVGRLKLNGSLVQRSPLSSVVEFEAMRLAIEANASAWRTLHELAGSDDRIAHFDLPRQLGRAAAQVELVERLRVRAAANTFTAS